MPKPTQISISHARSESEQHGSFVLSALLDDGSIWLMHSGDYGWERLNAPWEEKVTEEGEEPCLTSNKK